MDARAVIDAIKRETGINTDKALAEEMGIKYPTFANWITRDSLQYDVIIPFCQSKNIDMNQIFWKGSTVQNNSGVESNIESEFQAIADEIKHRCELYRDIGGQKMLNSFKEEINGVLERYDCIFDGMKAMIIDYLQKRETEPQKDE